MRLSAEDIMPSYDNKVYCACEILRGSGMEREMQPCVSCRAMTYGHVYTKWKLWKSLCSTCWEPLALEYLATPETTS